MPNGLLVDVAETMDRYGRLRLVNHPVHGLVLEATDRAVLVEVARAKKLAGMLGARVDADTVAVHPSERGRLKQGALQPNGLRMVLAARDECARRPGGTAGADDMVAALTFGFWTSLLSSRYDRQLWVPCLHRAFPNYRGRRGDLHDNLNAMRLFRNRIVHHEPIHHRDLAADHRKIYRLLNYIDATAAREAQAMDRVPVVLAHRQAVCDGSVRPRF